MNNSIDNEVYSLYGLNSEEQQFINARFVPIKVGEAEISELEAQSSENGEADNQDNDSEQVENDGNSDQE